MMIWSLAGVLFTNFNNQFMKREIKFRGKRIDSGEWIYGSLVGIDDTAVIVDHRDFGWDPHTDVNSFWFDMENNEVDPNTVGQYTGLKDKNDKEIYEGDIVDVIYRDYSKDEDFDRDYHCSGAVCFDENLGSYDVRIIEGEAPMFHDIIYEDEFTMNIGSFMYHDTVVIGNIHDNPELLKVE